LPSIKALIERGADPTITDLEGNNSFLLACVSLTSKDEKIWEYLFGEVLPQVASKLSPEERHNLFINQEDHRSIYCMFTDSGGLNP
jgi:hypothetical protein